MDAPITASTTRDGLRRSDMSCKRVTTCSTTPFITIVLSHTGIAGAPSAKHVSVRLHAPYFPLVSRP